MNRKPKVDMQREISKRVADFIDEHTGAETAAVKTFLFGNLLAVFVIPHATQNSAPGERLLQTHAAAIDRIDPRAMKQCFEEIVRDKVENLYFVAGQGGVRLLIVALSKNLENQLTEPHELQSVSAMDFKYFEQLIHENRQEAMADEGLWLAHNAEHPGASRRTGGVNHMTHPAKESASYLSPIEEEKESWRQDAAFAAN